MGNVQDESPSRASRTHTTLNELRVQMVRDAQKDSETCCQSVLLRRPDYSGTGTQACDVRPARAAHAQCDFLCCLQALNTATLFPLKDFPHRPAVQPARAPADRSSEPR